MGEVGSIYKTKSARLKIMELNDLYNKYEELKLQVEQLGRFL
jgi:hypothetical protein